MSAPHDRSPVSEPKQLGIAKFAVHRRVAVAMIATAIVVLGIFAVPRLPIALLPTFSPPIISVSVTYPNVSPEAMETLVTRPIENAVSRVSGIEVINSTSSQGTTNVRAQFHYGVNIDTAAVDVQAQVDRIRSQLPNDTNLQAPQIQKADPNALPVVRAFVTDPDLSQRDLNDLFTNQLDDEFSSVEGVGSVTSSAAQTRAIMIEPDLRLLAGYNIGVAQLVSRVQAENVNLAAGIVQIGRNEYQVRTNALYTDVEQIARTVVTRKNGANVLLRDVARVTDSIEEQRSFNRLDGKPALSLSITAQPDANVVGVADGVYKKLADIKKRYPGMRTGVALDQRGFILEAIGSLERTAVYGAVLAVLVILLFLHSFRSTLIVTVSLPISVLGTLFAAYLFGYSLNTMTLGGLALAVGLIVDDAIVVLENIYRHIDEGEPVLQACQSAVTQIFGAVVASSVTVITVFVPLVLVPGLQGLIFTPFAVMVMVAVALSLLVAVTTVPMLSALLWRTENTDAPRKRTLYTRFTDAFDRGYDRFERGYKRFLGGALDRPLPVFGIAIALFVATLLVLRTGVIATETFPPTNSRFVRFTMRMPVGTALNVTDAVSRDVETRLKRDPRVETVGSQIGTGGGPGGGTTPVTNQATVQVTLKEGVSSEEAGRFVQQWQGGLSGQAVRSRRGAAATSGQDGASMRKVVGAPIPGLAVFGRTIDIVSQILSQGQDALQIQILGPDVSRLSSLAKGLLPQIAQIPGVTRPDTNVTDSQPQVNVTMNRARAATLGLSTETIAQSISTATSGTIASYLQIEGTQYPIIVQAPDDQRRSIVALSNLPIALPNATGAVTGLTTNATTDLASAYNVPTTPLSDVATIELGTGPSQISRQNKQREIDINASLVNTPLGAAVAAAGPVMDAAQLPPGYRWQFGPAITQQSDTFGSLGLIVVLAIALIYMLLAAQFESFLHPLVIIVSVPLSLSGVVAGLALTHRSFGLTAFIGVLMLVGIVVKNAILVVEFTNQLRDEGKPVREALLEAAPLRLRPILMTSLATIGGMVPLALGLEAGSQSQAPLGTVVIGGLLCSTLLSLVVIPTLYLWTANTIESRFGGRREAAG